jgi:hypothetical protein
MMACDYAQNFGSENRGGLHREAFWPDFENASLEFQGLTNAKLAKFPENDCKSAKSG